jgi:hypothetical protein
MWSVSIFGLTMISLKSSACFHTAMYLCSLKIRLVNIYIIIIIYHITIWSMFHESWDFNVHFHKKIICQTSIELPMSIIYLQKKGGSGWFLSQSKTWSAQPRGWPGRVIFFHGCCIGRSRFALCLFSTCRWRHVVMTLTLWDRGNDIITNFGVNRVYVWIKCMTSSQNLTCGLFQIQWKNNAFSGLFWGIW